MSSSQGFIFLQPVLHLALNAILMTKSKLQLKANYVKTADVYEDINFLDAIYRKQFKKAPSVELFIGSFGPPKKTIIDLVAVYQKDDVDELNFYIEELNKKYSK